MIKVTKRLISCTLVGALLGVFCVIGASIRLGPDVAPYVIFSLWFNRLLMGILIGAPWGEVSLIKSLVRGALLGLIVSFAYYASSGFSDIVSFLAGIIYGVIIEYIAFLVVNHVKRNK